MKWFTRSVIALTVGLLITAAAAAAAFIVTMFNTQPGDGRRLTFFGSLFFEAVPLPGDGIGMEMGLADPLPLLVFLALATAAALAVMVVHRVLVRYREQLLLERSDV